MLSYGTPTVHSWWLPAVGKKVSVSEINKDRLSGSKASFFGKFIRSERSYA